LRRLAIVSGDLSKRPSPHQCSTNRSCTSYDPPFRQTLDSSLGRGIVLPAVSRQRWCGSIADVIRLAIILTPVRTPIDKLGPYGSVRGARGNSRPYRDRLFAQAEFFRLWHKADISVLPNVRFDPTTEIRQSKVMEYWLHYVTYRHRQWRRPCPGLRLFPKPFVRPSAVSDAE
jgi:hypothetical protein